ncbi:hypothetical protein D3C81_1117090 [compost metagenome]
MARRRPPSSRRRACRETSHELADAGAQESRARQAEQPFRRGTGKAVRSLRPGAGTGAGRRPAAPSRASCAIARAAGKHLAPGTADGRSRAAARAEQRPARSASRPAPRATARPSGTAARQAARQPQQSAAERSHRSHQRRPGHRAPGRTAGDPAAGGRFHGLLVLACQQQPRRGRQPAWRAHAADGRPGHGRRCRSHRGVARGRRRPAGRARTVAARHAARTAPARRRGGTAGDDTGRRASGRGRPAGETAAACAVQPATGGRARQQPDPGSTQRYGAADQPRRAASLPGLQRGPAGRGAPAI